MIDMTSRFTENWPNSRELTFTKTENTREKINTFHITVEIAYEQKERLRNILRENVADTGVCPKTIHHINLIRTKSSVLPYRHNPEETEFIREQKKQWLKAGIIRKPYSRYLSP